MALQESGEMYLETIYVLSKTHTNVRSVDIGEELGYSRPSVSRAMHLLKDEGLVKIDEYG
ncbi:MAG: metal-dependent transcriptional regulator, partial [Butyrivibrio sp.]|nr:metal-dependent transcriptional regulator [Butyrivibrio sp.]